MTELQPDIPVLSYDRASDAPPNDHRAALALVVSTILWGAGFTWAKAAGTGVHRVMELPDGSLLGPIWVLAWRFLLAGVTLVVFVPAARRGWTWGDVGRSAAVGAILATASIIQHLGLDRTSEAVTAFLTSLTILFVPLMAMVAFRKLPAPILWVGVIMATVGVWMLLMTGEKAGGFGAGEALGLACAALFAVYILSVNVAARTVPPWRLAAGQFLITSALCFITCFFVKGGPSALSPAGTAQLFTHRVVWLNVLLMAVFPTLIAFALLNLYQPRLDPTRAALIYLIEPVVAAAYAWVVLGPARALGTEALLGAGLILIANVLVEVLSTRTKGSASASLVHSPGTPGEG